ncbi:hypothetical protein [Spirosoma koreense]
MKNILCIIALSVAVWTSCKKNDNEPGATPTPTASINRKWKYDSNLDPNGCTGLLGTVWEIKNGMSTNVSVPAGVTGFTVGENMLKNIAQTTSPYNYTASGYSRGLSGPISDPNILVKITVAKSVNSMTIDYGNTIAIRFRYGLKLIRFFRAGQVH